jgi:hypothetical protein
MSKLKETFEIARDQNNIALILPEFLSAIFSIVGIKENTNDKIFDYVLTKSPLDKEMCVTISETPKLVSFDKWCKAELNGRDLLKTIPKNAGILIVYETGGDYLTRDQIDWFLGILDQ